MLQSAHFFTSFPFAIHSFLSFLSLKNGSDEYWCTLGPILQIKWSDCCKKSSWFPHVNEAYVPSCRLILGVWAFHLALLCYFYFLTRSNSPHSQFYRHHSVPAIFLFVTFQANQSGLHSLKLFSVLCLHVSSSSDDVLLLGTCSSALPASQKHIAWVCFKGPSFTL